MTNSLMMISKEVIKDKDNLQSGKNILRSSDARKPSSAMSEFSTSPSLLPQMPGEKLGSCVQCGHCKNYVRPIWSPNLIKCPTCCNPIHSSGEGNRIRLKDKIRSSIGSRMSWGCTSSHSTLHGSSSVHRSSGLVSMSSMVQQKKRAFLCGISYRKKKYELKGTINDVKNMKQLLIERFAFPEESIRILTEEEKDDWRKPTRKNILESLKWLVKDCASGDSLLFFFSGHGLRYPESEKGDELDGYDESICPVDFVREGVIRDNEINSIIVEPLKEGVTLHAIVDACHSGTVLDLPNEYDLNNDEWLDVGPPSGTYKGTRGGVAICLSACPDAELAADTSALTGRKMSGAMTTSFINSILRQSNITYRDLLDSMNKVIDEANQSNCLNAPVLARVFNARLSQEPVLSASEKFNIRKKFVL